MNIEEKFAEFYNKFLTENKDNFDAMENQRKKAIDERYINKLIIITVECIVLIILMCAIFVSDSEVNKNGELDWLWLIAFGVPLLIAIKGKKQLKEYENMYQDKVVRSVIKDFSNTLDYFPLHKKIMDGDFARIGPQKYNEFHSSNLIKGMYKNNEITMAKIITKNTYATYDYQDAMKKVTSIETFDGMFIKVKLQKNIKNSLYFKNKKYLRENQFRFFVDEKNKVLNEKREYEKVDIPTLNELFSIYALNSNEVRELLDTELIEKLKDINNEQLYEFLIEDDYIYIRFWIDGLFSNPPLKKETTDKDILCKNYKMLYIIFYLISELNDRIEKLNYNG